MATWQARSATRWWRATARSGTAPLPLDELVAAVGTRGFALVEPPHHDSARTRLGAVSGVAVREVAEVGHGADGQVLKVRATPLS
ncbi:hypothetical protein [Actinosynnema pretiosum]|uniref:Uncharacterized protein n=1 Tax=Actinosynnema pretiosum TaxID=42197 RepID=A0A290Z8L4_9PSEU|nr:hypothetical protein [Actinosynnema pretiosum]ATE55309.1 hypothetical protein CNX65_20150 [Actinosynnema pretiosum]